MSRISIGSGEMICVIDPVAGGSVAALRLGALDLLRPAPPRHGSDFDALTYAAFPMLPFVGRIHHGQFAFHGRRVDLPANMPPEPHAIHGHAWQAGWTVASVADSRALLTFEHASSAWPWSYRAAQEITVRDDTLSVTLKLTNLSDSAMPGGIGWHPYFPRAGAMLTLNTTAAWATDPESGQNRRSNLSPDDDLSIGRMVDQLSLDDTFSVGARRVEMTWPSHSLTMRSDPLFMAATVFVPPGRDFFCVEPVSHIPNAVRGDLSKAATGLRVLAPGETLSGTIVLSVQR